jgi:hypothetical protein
MSQQELRLLPPNPFQLSPIKKVDNLAGRAQEQKNIRYYLELTAAGQNPHIALIGQRGVGKTSVLNCSEQIAKDLLLLPIRLDMNELKAQSPGRFWHDLYQNLILTMVTAGCWGGIQGEIYRQLLKMLHSHSPGDLDCAVIQIPYVFSCHTAGIDEFDCPDALVVHDLRSCQKELETRGLKGIVLIIDEADCLGTNVPLLQMFRNIFQAVDSCSLMLAGTEAVFPAISSVFSPIPRQFHRIDIRPFAQWPDTMDLIRRPLGKYSYDTIGPKMETVRELHELCGGAPDEVQLYCHHMYRSVEDGTLARMSLSPKVYRQVLREYRKNTPSNVDAILNAIERLPDKLLYKSIWTSRRELSLDENIRLSIFKRTLSAGQIQSDDQRNNARSEITAGYQTLYDAGIIQIPTKITLTGAPLTAGFWKSFVTVEREKRWSWNDQSLANNISDSIAQWIAKQCGDLFCYPLTGNSDAVNALRTLREGKIPTDVDEGMMEMVATAIMANEGRFTHAVDIVFQIESFAGRHTQRVRYFEKPDVELDADVFSATTERLRPLAEANDITVSVSAIERWKLPTNKEVQQLAIISGHPLPPSLGRSPMDEAFAKFEEGDVEESKRLFAEVLRFKESANVRNNLAFCQILTGQFRDGFENSKKAVGTKYSPLYAMNNALSQFLLEDTDTARQSFREIWLKTRNSTSENDKQAAYVLILDDGGKSVHAHPAIPVDAAVLLNMALSGSEGKGQVIADLTRRYPDKIATWVAAHLGGPDPT